ncbi:LysR family transcriptional regulator [Xanthomonas campestris pv. cannae]|nr:LysR family transcriptional regulator [Xanthomonas campestris pv. cannae]
MLTFSRFTRYFMEVAHWRSIRRASEALHVSASAIDRQILKAEQELGVQLFERLPGGLRLTSAGELLLVDMRRWEKSYQRTLELFDELKGLRRGHVEIAMIDALSEGIVVDALAHLIDAHPGLTFNLLTEDNQKVADKVVAAEVDVGLLLDPVSGIDLEVVAFAEIPLGLCMPVGHPLSGRASLQLNDLLGEHRLLLPAAPLIVNEHAKAVYQRQHIDTRRCIRCNDVRTLRALVCQGVGVGLLSQLDVLADLADGRLAFVPLREGLARPMTLALCVAPQRQLSRAAQAMLKVLAPRVEAILEPRTGV